MQGDIQGDTPPLPDAGGYGGIQGDTGAPASPGPADPLEGARQHLLAGVRMACVATEHTRKTGYAHDAREYESMLWRLLEHRLRDYRELLDTRDAARAIPS